MADEKNEFLLLNILSVKGGVGKSTLSLLCGAYLASLGTPAWIIDLDFIGTNLAAGLKKHNLASADTEKESEENLEHYLTNPPLMNYNTEKMKNEIDLCWRFTSKESGLANLCIIPSSVGGDLKRRLEPLLATEHWTGYLRNRILELVTSNLKVLPTNSKAAVIFDHGPGLHEVSDQFLDKDNPIEIEIENRLGGRKVEKINLMVSSGDSPDIEAVGRFLRDYLSKDEQKIKEELQRYHFVFNRLGSFFDYEDEKYLLKAKEAFRDAIWGLFDVTKNIDTIRYNKKLLIFDVLDHSEEVGPEKFGNFVKEFLPNLQEKLIKFVTVYG